MHYVFPLFRRKMYVTFDEKSGWQCRWLQMHVYYIDTDEVPRFFLLEKNHIFIARSQKVLFLSFTCEDIGVAMVTNMISQHD